MSEPTIETIFRVSDADAWGKCNPDFPGIVVYEYGKAEVVPGTAAMVPDDLRALSKCCLRAAEFIEGGEGEKNQ